MSTNISTKTIELTPERQNNFNIIRFASAIMVIYGHMFSIMKIGNTPIFMGQTISTIGINILFLISGYLVGQSYERDPNLLRYVIRRSFRVMPGLIVLVLLTVFVIGEIFTTGSHIAYLTHPLIGQYLSNILLKISYSLPNVFDANPYATAINGSLWSLPVEVFMYAVLPVIAFSLKKVKIRTELLAGITVFMIVLSFIFQDTPSLSSIVHYQVIISAALAVAPYFLVGYLFSQPKIKKILNLQAALFMFIFFAFIQFTTEVSEAMLFFVLPYVVFSIALTAKPIFKNFGTKNDYSYGLYLYGFVSQQMLMNIFAVQMHADLPFYAYLLMSIGLALLFAFFSWHCVEKPMQNLSRQLCANLKAEKSMSKLQTYGIKRI